MELVLTAWSMLLDEEFSNRGKKTLSPADQVKKEFQATYFTRKLHQHAYNCALTHRSQLSASPDDPDEDRLKYFLRASAWYAFTSTYLFPHTLNVLEGIMWDIRGARLPSPGSEQSF